MQGNSDWVLLAAEKEGTQGGERRRDSRGGARPGEEVGRLGGQARAPHAAGAILVSFRWPSSWVTGARMSTDGSIQNAGSTLSFSGLRTLAGCISLNLEPSLFPRYEITSLKIQKQFENKA